MKQKLSITLWVVLTLITFFPRELKACTGITLRAKDGSRIVARTIEWGGSNLNSQYVVVPRGYKQQSYIPGGTTEGMIFTARYGYIGLAVEQEQFVAEGLNEAGLSAGLFYFPQYGKYETYNSKEKASSIADLQLVSWILGSCRTVDEVKESIKKVHVIGIDPRASTAHWRFADTTGRQIVLEIINEKPIFYENKLGVLTNSPSFDWQMTNLNNYGPLPTTGRSDSYIFRKRKWFSWYTRRHHPSFPIYPCRFLSSDRTTARNRTTNRYPMFPNAE